MTDLLDCSTAVVKRYGGTLSQFTGDGIIAVFGAPITLEDHAVRACLAALDIQEEAKRLAAEVHDRDGVDLRLARTPATIRPVAFDVSMPSGSDPCTMFCSPSPDSCHDLRGVEFRQSGSNL